MFRERRNSPKSPDDLLVSDGSYQEYETCRLRFIPPVVVLLVTRWRDHFRSVDCGTVVFSVFETSLFRWIAQTTSARPGGTGRLSRRFVGCDDCRPALNTLGRAVPAPRALGLAVTFSIA